MTQNDAGISSSHRQEEEIPWKIHQTRKKSLVQGRSGKPGSHRKSSEYSEIRGPIRLSATSIMISIKKGCMSAEVAVNPCSIRSPNMIAEAGGPVLPNQ